MVENEFFFRSPEREGFPRGKRKALVVGINDYDGTVNDLPSCVKDAESVAGMLHSLFQFQEVKVLKDDQAKIGEVQSGLQWLMDGAEPGDTLVFYYSGHGQTLTKGKTKEEYLVLHDGLFHDDTLSRLTQSLPDNVLTVILDSCFAGGLEKKFYEKVVTPVAVAEKMMLSSLGIPAKSSPEETARVKAFMPDTSKAKNIWDAEAKATMYKPFGMPPRPVRGAKTSFPPSDEIGQLQMRGLLISACTEFETASASTSQTNGLSAFTYCLLKILHQGGAELPVRQLVDQVKEELHRLGFPQTPCHKDAAMGTRLMSPLFGFGYTTTQREIPMNDQMVLNAVLTLLRMASEGQKAPYGYASHEQKGWTDLIPVLIDAVTRKSYAGYNFMPVSKEAEQQQKFLETLIIAAAPVLVRALTKEYAMPHQKSLFDLIGGPGPFIPQPPIVHFLKGETPVQQKFLGELLIAVAPVLIERLTKEYSYPPADKNASELIRVLLPLLTSTVASQSKGESDWERIAATLIPVIVQALSQNKSTMESYVNQSGWAFSDNDYRTLQDRLAKAIHQVFANP